MRPTRVTSNKYTFSVEGQTERLYLEWLQQQINNCPDATHKVLFSIAVEKDPVRLIKRSNIISKTTIYHLCDYEEDTAEYIKRFESTIDKMIAARNTKQIQYELGYSNLTFELWMILHKMDSNNAYTDRRQYLGAINRAYNTSYLSLDDYKHENNFKACLAQLSLDDVRAAVKRADRIMDQRANNGCKPVRYRNYPYYRENPSLTINDVIRTIMKDCGLMN